ncbi:MAG: 2-hydroxyacyl-CoA dehydratase family protein [Peptococcaceae bacterium]|jgi:benzoyl-CoA reductase/2-hydroxyglutaryl-CoA dehydratase subunit BcrC/BadD/HgdB|nr:2-hydroxyacyl-CoA dehydratase family protein [Peptococcaceae bacterium]
MTTAPASKTRDLPGIFDTFAEARQKGFLTMKGLKDQGRGVVGIFCTYTPLEVFMAADLVTVGLCSTSDETIPEAEKELPRNLCPLIKASYGFAITDKCPYMYFSDLVVGETTCDGKKKMYELLAKIKNVHVMELPKSQNKPASLAFWREEIIALAREVEKVFGVVITEESLRDAIRRRNRERALLKEAYELSKMTPPPMTGLQQLQLLFGFQFQFNEQARLRGLEDSIANLRAAYAAGQRPVGADARRIVITGCPMGGVTEKVTRAIEEAGGVVVAYENCTGAKQYDRQARETGDPYQALAEYYLAIGCSVMSPNPNRLELLGRLCEEFQADGVIEMTLQACHTYAIETHTIREFLREKDIPFISLETDYSTGDIGQIKTRVGAFLEML